MGPGPPRQGTSPAFGEPPRDARPRLRRCEMQLELNMTTVDIAELEQVEGGMVCVCKPIADGKMLCVCE